MRMSPCVGAGAALIADCRNRCARRGAAKSNTTGRSKKGSAPPAPAISSARRRGAGTAANSAPAVSNRRTSFPTGFPAGGGSERGTTDAAPRVCTSASRAYRRSHSASARSGSLGGGHACSSAAAISDALPNRSARNLEDGPKRRAVDELQHEDGAVLLGLQVVERGDDAGVVQRSHHAGFVGEHRRNPWIAAALRREHLEDDSAGTRLLPPTPRARLRPFPRDPIAARGRTWRRCVRLPAHDPLAFLDRPLPVLTLAPHRGRPIGRARVEGEQGKWRRRSLESTSGRRTPWSRSWKAATRR